MIYTRNSFNTGLSYKLENFKITTTNSSQPFKMTTVTMIEVWFENMIMSLVYIFFIVKLFYSTSFFSIIITLRLIHKFTKALFLYYI